MLKLPLTAAVPSTTLYIGRNAESFQLSGRARVDMKNRGAFRRILRALVDARREPSTRRAGLAVCEVFDAGWFGEMVDAETMAGRVYSAISKLRRMGLGPAIVRSETGYMIDPRICVIEDAPLTMTPKQATIILEPGASLFPTRLAS
ncbi:MAG: hypothetical protein KF819_26220 [Labilithrix sp.]|nr:hypothetical protein [Labilithrix sp.]